MINVQDNNEVKNLIELGEKISNKKLLEKVRALSTFPCDTNNFSKLVLFKDTKFVLDTEKQDEIGKLLFTKKELDEISNNDFLNCLLYAYVWVYSFKDENEKFKITPNVPELELEISRKTANKIMAGDTQLVYETAKVDEKELSEWEKELVTRQVYSMIYEPVNSAMGLALKL